MDVRQPDDETVIAWLRQQAIPLGHVEPGRGFDDLAPLRRVLAGATVVGLGEATHGTREFFKLKHRLLEFLITELGYTVLAIEASHAACQPINDYVLHGRGEREAVAVGQGYLAWATEEFVALLDWLRAWNARVSTDRAVWFVGTDVTFNARGRDAVLATLRRLAPESELFAAEAFRVLAEEEARWPLGIDAASEIRAGAVLPRLDDLIAALAGTGDGRERAAYLLRVMRQWWDGGGGARSQHMGENLVELIDRERPGAKVVYWGHNFHIGIETFLDREPTAGHVLRQRFGDAYYPCALEFGDGTYQTRAVGDGGRLTDLTVDGIGPAQSGTLPWYLSQTGLDRFVVDLRARPRPRAVEDWLARRLMEHGGTGWLRGADPEASWEPVAPGQQYDGVAFVARSTPARPLAAARAAAARGEWF